MRKYLLEVEKQLGAIPRPPKRWLAEDYVGGGESKLKYLNIKIPDVRHAYRMGFSFSDLEPEEQWKIWDYIWHHSKTFEVMLLSILWADSRPLEDVLKHHKTVVGWLPRVDNWAHSDGLSAHYARMLEHDFKKFHPVFQKWSASKKPWLNRQALVGLLFYSRFRKKTPPASLLLKFIEKHIDDEHYYVQKGVGWALRECWNVYPKETFAYLKKNAGRIPPAGWTAATEKLSRSDKKTLSEIRRQRYA